VRNIGEMSRAPASGARILAYHKPAGIAVLVTPWNFPAAMATRKIGPALAAGCPVVLKPASDTPLTMLALMPALEEAGVPAGVVNVVPSRRSGPVVSDQGMGIDEQLRKDLGRPFVQLEGHLARKNGGIGLGLAISRGLAELMGGSLSIDSEPGEGTRVILRLRTAEKPAAEKAAA
jgi:hypothetical protein